MACPNTCCIFIFSSLLALLSIVLPLYLESPPRRSANPPCHAQEKGKTGEVVYRPSQSPPRKPTGPLLGRHLPHCPKALWKMNYAFVQHRVQWALVHDCCSWALQEQHQQPTRLWFMRRMAQIWFCTSLYLILFDETVHLKSLLKGISCSSSWKKNIEVWKI